MKTLAELFSESYGKRYQPVKNFKRDIGPSPFVDSRNWHVSYTITFKDSSTCEAIMNGHERTGITRSRWFKDNRIKTIGGNGYRVPIVKF